MIINDGFIEDIVYLSALKYKGVISREQKTDLFDLIDDLDKDEIAEVYAVVLYQSNYSPSFDKCMEEATEVDFDAVDILFNMGNIGYLLEKGVKRLMEEGVIK